MNLLSPYPAIVLILLALLTIHLAGKAIPLQPDKSRYKTIDGLRGYLAFFVFLHHSMAWYYRIHINVWLRPPSNLYNHFGPTSVSLFFMITSFLFFSKLIDARNGSLDWLKLYVGRFLRIVPLYLLMLTIILCIVAWITRFTLNEPVHTILGELAQWLVYIQSPINGVPQPGYIEAGVVWSLPFEWMFYCSLAACGKLFFKIRTSASILIISLLGLIIFMAIIYTYYPVVAGWWLLTFSGGIVAAFLSKNKKFCVLAAKRITSFVLVTFLVITIVFFQNIFSLIPCLCMALFFIGVACGNSIFGILTALISRIFGQISYSIYLLHGIVLFVTFTFIIDGESAATFSPLQHWCVLSICAIFLILICSFTYYYIERPFQKSVNKVTSQIKSSILVFFPLSIMINKIRKK